MSSVIKETIEFTDGVIGTFEWDKRVPGTFFATLRMPSGRRLWGSVHSNGKILRRRMLAAARRYGYQLK